MARVVALIGDLLFGSNVQGALRAGGHEVELVGDEASARARLPEARRARRRSRQRRVRRLRARGGARRRRRACRTRTLGFYSHVDVDTRARALNAGFDLVVPRSRMAREGAALVTQLAGR